MWSTLIISPDHQLCSVRFLISGAVWRHLPGIPPLGVGASIALPMAIVLECIWYWKLKEICAFSVYLGHLYSRTKKATLQTMWCFGGPSNPRTIDPPTIARRFQKSAVSRHTMGIGIVLPEMLCERNSDDFQGMFLWCPEKRERQMVSTYLISDRGGPNAKMCSEVCVSVHCGVFGEGRVHVWMRHTENNIQQSALSTCPQRLGEGMLEYSVRLRNPGVTYWRIWRLTFPFLPLHPKNGPCLFSSLIFLTAAGKTSKLKRRYFFARFHSVFLQYISLFRWAKQKFHHCLEDFLEIFLPVFEHGCFPCHFRHLSSCQ